MTNLHTLTHPQKRIWYIENIYPGTSIYSVGSTTTIDSKLNFKILEKAINLTVQKHDALRMRLTTRNNEPYQYIAPYTELKLDFFDFSNNHNPEESYNNWLDEEVNRPFTLLDSDLTYYALIKIDNNKFGFFHKHHHITCDGWAAVLAVKDVVTFYNRLKGGENVKPETENSYIEYISAESEYLKSDRFLTNKEYWNNKFRVLPYENDNIETPTNCGKRKKFQIDLDLSSVIRNFCNSNKITLNAFFTALYSLYKSRTEQKGEIIFGSPVLNRTGKKEKRIVGMFASTVPLKINLAGSDSFLELINKVNIELKNSFINQKYPYDLLVQDLELKKKGINSLFSSCVNNYGNRMDIEMEGRHVNVSEFHSGYQTYSMQIIIREWLGSECLTLEYDYKTDLYTEDEIDEVHKVITTLIKQVTNNPAVDISQLDCLNKDDYKLVNRLNCTKENYSCDKTVIELFDEQVEKTPDSIAVSFKDRKLTYTQLKIETDKLAALLSNKGVDKEKVVAIYTEHSIESVVAILSVLKAGGAFLPIDPSTPRKRIEYMLNESNAILLLSNINIEYNLSCPVVDLREKVISKETKKLSYPSINSLAYIIYTSGSTGTPKGTQLEQRGLTNYISWAKKTYTDGKEVFPLYSSLAFDLTITSIFTPLISGGEVAVYADNEDEYVLYRIIKDNRSTVIKLTPSHLKLLTDIDFISASIKRFIVGGEDLKVSLANEIYNKFNNVDIFNEYGPTETFVGCMIHRFDPDKDKGLSVPIGIPSGNKQIYILDKDMKELPFYCNGEIYIGGIGISRGYINRDELNKKTFLPDPFNKGCTMYKSGDIAKRLPDGKIIFIGRADSQVKINGYRIELDEIEQTILKNCDVRNVVVTDMTDVNGNSFISSYYTAENEIDIFSKIKEQLPNYMMPKYFTKLDEIPLTGNGKVNKKLLPLPQITIEKFEDFIGTESEIILVNTIKEILKLDNVSVNENFHHLGGDSIKAIQIVSKFRNSGYKIAVKDILNSQSICETLSYIEVNNNSLEEENLTGCIKDTPIISWFKGFNFSENAFYHQSILLEMKVKLSAAKLDKLASELIDQHDILRANFNNGTLSYTDKVEINSKSYDLKSVNDDDFKKICFDEKGSFNLESDPLIKFTLFNFPDNSQKLLIIAHHLIVDGVSWRIILDDFQSLYRGEELPSKTTSFKRWSEELLSFAESEKESYTYWKNIVDNNLEKPFPNVKSNREVLINTGTELSEDLTSDLVSDANRAYGTDTQDLLLASLSKTVKNHFGLEEILIELEGHGREDLISNIDITRTVGWFTSIYPFKLKFSSENLNSLIKSVKEDVNSVPRKGISYGLLRYTKGNESLDYGTPSIRFNYLGDLGGSIDNSLFSWSETSTGSDISTINQKTAVIEINAYISNKKLKISMDFDTTQIKKEDGVKFLEEYKSVINEVIAHCLNRDSVDFTPSDFSESDIPQDELDALFC